MKVFQKLLICLAVLFLISIPASARNAWSYAGYEIPEPGDPLWTQSTLDQRNAISYNDSSRWETKLTNSHNQSDYQMYSFNVMQPAGNVNNITAKWIGYGENQTDYDTYLYIWNDRNVSWELLDRKNLPDYGILNGSITTNISDYIDPDGIVYTVAGARHYDYASPAPSGLNMWAGNQRVYCSWSPVTDPDGDKVQYFAEIVGGANSGWMNDTSFSDNAIAGTFTCRVKTRDNYTYTESIYSSISFDKSSCPFVYAWNGSDYEYRTDLEGQVIGAPFFKVKGYRAGLYDIGAIEPEQGKYKIKVRETIAEADYFDEAKVWIVDFPNGYDVYTDWHDVYIPGLPVTYNLYTVKDTKKPVSAYDKSGRDVTLNLLGVDDFPVNETLNDTNYYILDFGTIEHPEYAKLIVYGWNAFLKREGDTDPYKNITSYHEQNTIIEVINQSGKWQKVREFGRLSGDLKPVVFNISNIWLSSDRRIRIHPAYSKFATMVLDKIEFDDSIPVPVDVKKIRPDYAELGHGGADSYTYPDLKRRLHASDSVNNDSESGYFYGNFTKYGNVLPLLDEPDDKFVIMRHGDELKLEFPAIQEKNGKNRKIFLYSDVFYSIKKTVDGTFLSDNVEPLPFHGMSKYPYDISVENYPQDKEHSDYLKEWNTRVCEKGKKYCYDSRKGDIKPDILYYLLPQTLNNVEKEKVRSLNTNYIELIVNDQVIGNNIFNVGSINALNSYYISWDNDILSDNRIYYGQNETEVNYLVNGSWSPWINNSLKPLIRLSGLPENTTYYYRPVTWYSGTINSSIKAKLLSTGKQEVQANPAEYMVSPAGWKGSPENFRTVNIFAALIDNNGSYIHNSSPEAVIVGISGVEFGRIGLGGAGPYYGNFTLPDFLSDERGFIWLKDYSASGEFSILKWSCKNCHQDAGRYPSTFNNATVHPRHTDTRHSFDCDSCHRQVHADPDVSMVGCNGNSCHKTDVACNECHNDIQNSLDVSNTSVLSVKYGMDVHLDKESCVDCHGGLTSINASPSCAACHPLNGSNLTSVPPGTMSHSYNNTVACVLCHNPHDINSLKMDISGCKACHPGITHNDGEQCTTCHGNDPHYTLGGGCIACHSSPDKISFVNTSFFGKHANIARTDGQDNVTDEDCKKCHFGSGSMTMKPGNANETNTYFCQDCHTSGGRNPSQYNNITDGSLRKTPMPPGHGNNTCKDCHIIGADQPLANGSRYHSYGPRGYSDFLKP